MENTKYGSISQSSDDATEISSHSEADAADKTMERLFANVSDQY